MRSRSLRVQLRASLHRALPTVLLLAASVMWFPRPVASSVTLAEPTRANAAPGAAATLETRASVEVQRQPLAQVADATLAAAASTAEVAPAQPPVAAPVAQARPPAPAPAAAPPARGVPSAEAVPAVEPTAAWAKTSRETGIWSGWDASAKEFAKIGPDITVQVLEVRGERAFVYFPGDTKGHRPGEVWIDRAALTDLPWPRWTRARRPTALRAAPDQSAEALLPLARGSYVEATGETRGRWAQAFFLLDSQPGESVVGWVDGADLMLPRGDQREMSTYLLTRSLLESSLPELWLRVPYRSQLDGSPYAEANCGPTSVAMALGLLGLTETTGAIREAALELQDMPKCDDCGLFIQHLASVAEARGAKIYGLHDSPETLHRWSVEDVRQALRAGRVVIPQVKYRLLPGRADSPYGGDHYIVVTGLTGDGFIYNDPIDSDGRGYGRLISAEALDKAMAGAADKEFARAAFAVGR